MSTDFAGAFAALREILRKHADGMIVQSDTPTDYTVVTQAIGLNGKPMWFGCVLSKKSAVTYHLMPLYFNPKLNAAVAPELAARKQGKTCFNFQRPDTGLFEKLDALTAQARQHFERQGLLEPGPVSAEQMAAGLRAAGVDTKVLAAERKAKVKAAAAKRAATVAKRRRGNTR